MDNIDHDPSSTSAQDSFHGTGISLFQHPNSEVSGTQRVFLPDNNSLRLVNRTKPIADPIKRNNLSLFSRPPVRKKSKEQLHLSSIKNDCSLFSRLYIASQVRDGDLDAFFEHENQACPPALSQVGNIRLGQKSDLVGCLEDLIPPRENASSPAVEFVILDGAAIVNMLGTRYYKDLLWVCNAGVLAVRHILVATCEQGGCCLRWISPG